MCAFAWQDRDSIQGQELNRPKQFRITAASHSSADDHENVAKAQKRLLGATGCWEAVVSPRMTESAWRLSPCTW